MIKIIDALSGLRLTLLSGLFLGASLLVWLGRLELPVDPAWATIVISGSPLAYIAVTRLVGARQITSSLLITLAMLAAIIIGELFAAGEVAFIMAIGSILEDKTVQRARRGIRELINLAPQQARRIFGNTEEIVPIEAVQRDDILRVLPGETIPVDGEIIRGSTSIDQSVMTGESLPVDRTEGDAVFSGTLNRFGAVDIRAEKVGEDSSLQKLIRMVREAETNQAPMQRIVDRWAAWIVPAALLIALGTYLATHDIIRAVTVLVVFCPCALALATPTSIMAAIGQATKHGVLIKSGKALENMGQVDYIAFDKTGTLTHGHLQVSNVLTFTPEYPETEILRLTAAAESLSEHPLANAVLSKARSARLTFPPATDFKMIPGRGVSAQVGGETVYCGTPRFLEESGLCVSEEVLSVLENLRRQGKAAILTGLLSGQAGCCIGIVALSDTLRASVANVVQELRALNTTVLLLTGDHADTAAYFAAQAGVYDVRSGLLPAQKVECIKEMQAQGHIVCMVGDGVNDAPALKTADVSVAMGSMGSDLAIEAADIALMSDDLNKIPYLKRLATAAINTIKFNISLAMLINFVAVGLSITGWLNPVSGALVHNAGAVLVVLNAALLYDRKLK